MTEHLIWKVVIDRINDGFLTMANDEWIFFCCFCLLVAVADAIDDSGDVSLSVCVSLCVCMEPRLRSIVIVLMKSAFVCGRCKTKIYSQRTHVLN